VILTIVGWAARGADIGWDGWFGLLNGAGGWLGVLTMVVMDGSGYWHW
jgi:hypothetical protein